MSLKDQLFATKSLKVLLDEMAVPLYEAFVAAVRAQGIPTATGRFGAMMQVELVNDGPVTLIVDSK